MKTKLLYILFTIHGFSLFAQGIVLKNHTLTESEFNTIIRNSFATVLTGQSASAVGSFASADIEKTEFTFAPNFHWSNGNTFAAKLKGGITDGAAALFENSKFNTNLSLDLQFNILLKKNSSVTFDTKVRDAYLSKIRGITDKYDIKIIKINTIYVLDSIRNAKDELVAENMKLNAEILLIADPSNNKSKVNATKILINTEKINQVNAKIATYAAEIVAPGWTAEQITEAGENLEKEKKKLAEKFELRGFAFKWLTLSYKIRNDDFRLFDPSQTYDLQVVKKDFISHEFRSQYSYYNYSVNGKTLYISGGATYKYKNNLSDLKSVAINELSSTGISGNTERAASKTYTAYMGNYRKGYNQAVADIDIYYFLFPQNKLGIHLFPVSKFSHKSKPIYNLGFGIVMPFKNSKKDSPVVNAELYYNALNISDTADSDYAFLERNDIGIRLTFPINF